MSSPSPLPPVPIDPTSPPYSTHIHNGVFLDLDSTSSSDYEGITVNAEALLDWEGQEGGGGGTHVEENPDSVYMFAWALDGRRIGEGGAGNTGRAESPNSITAPIVSKIQSKESKVH